MQTLLSATRLTRCLFNRSTAAGGPAPAEWSAESLVTRLGPSTRVPGAQGVFATRRIKKHTPLEILPAFLAENTESSGATSLSLSSSSLPPSTRVEAPPFLCNLLEAPQHSISLRRFLALRAHFTDKAGRFLHAATPKGWFLLLPASAVPVPDPEGLQRWCSIHHHRYLASIRSNEVDTHKGVDGVREGSAQRGLTTAPTRAAALRHAKARALAAQEKPWMLPEGTEDSSRVDGENINEGLSQEELEAVWRDIKAEREAQRAQDLEGGVDVGQKEEEEYDDDDTEVFNHEEPMGNTSAAEGLVGVSRSTDAEDGVEGLLTQAVVSSTDGGPSPVTLKRPPLVIPESHLFEINDGVLWQLPPSDDLANPQYWKTHRQRMGLYVGTGGYSVEDKHAFLAAAMEEGAAGEATDAGLALTEREAYQQGARVFDALTHKANVALDVQESTGLVTLRPLVDLEEGQELLLHYGREWWTERLLFQLFLSAREEEMREIRWIEALFSEPTDTFTPFPLLHAAHKVKKKKKSKGAARRQDKKPNTDANHANENAATQGGRASSPLVLYNLSTKKEATDAEVLVWAVRLSSISAEFLALLLSGPQPVFASADADAELPMKRLRRAVLHAMRGYPEDGSYHQPERMEDDRTHASVRRFSAMTGKDTRATSPHAAMSNQASRSPARTREHEDAHEEEDVFKI